MPLHSCINLDAPLVSCSEEHIMPLEHSLQSVSYGALKRVAAKPALLFFAQAVVFAQHHVYVITLCLPTADMQ